MQGVSHLLAGGQIPGARPYQEDKFELVAFRRTDRDACDVLVVLADGMGGHRGGAKASELAVSTFAQHFMGSGGDIAQRLRQSLEAANAAIGHYVAEHVDYADMGCTLVACAVTNDERAYWISVGDSPLWRLRGDVLERLNADHSMRPVLEDLVRFGRMTEEEFRRDGSVNQLRSALMGEPPALVDLSEAPITMESEDRLIVASDGLQTLPPREILGICGDRTAADDVVSSLLDAVDAKAAPRQDNATVVVYHHVEASALGRRFAAFEEQTRPVRKHG